MYIHQNFTGGNIRVEKTDGNEVFLNNELRDSENDWFYWAFCVENAAGKTLTFHFPKDRIGYFGPAVSHNLESWKWLESGNDNDMFTYTFGVDEDKVYFAHSMLYHPKRFYSFAKDNNIEVLKLCKSEKGRDVPYITFGNGKRIILLTARHHSCESSGSYVLQGVLEELKKNQIPESKVICIPFVDFDGVVDGDQGKGRVPYDHNRDYVQNQPAIYSAVREIRNIAEKGIAYGFDFHSPWHLGKQNDTALIVQKRINKLEEYRRFGKIFEDSVSANAFKYYQKNDFPPNVEWNSPSSPCFACYMLDKANAELAFTLETPYFGTKENRYTEEGAIELGRCFARALNKYDKIQQE